MTVQSGALETSFQAVVRHGEAFAVAFYERLFTRFPSSPNADAITEGRTGLQRAERAPAAPSTGQRLVSRPAKRATEEPATRRGFTKHLVAGEALIQHDW
jgi:hypothetical protein